jgi:hypothetical protein
MAALITYNDIKAVVDMSANVSSIKSAAAIFDTQNIDIKDAIGNGLLLQLTTALDSLPLSTALSDLYNGCTYTYTDYTFNHVGLKRIACLYAYARLLEKGNITVTQFGAVEKKSEYSDYAQDKSLARSINAFREEAFRYLIETKEFIIRNIADYPLYNGYFKSDKRGVQIKIIGN